MEHTRHASLFSARNTTVSLIGAGGIGAATALVLGKMGVGNLAIYDDDRVAPENMATQLHMLKADGDLKVFAVKEMVEQFSDDTAIFPVGYRVQKDTDLSDQILISAVDSITARKDIWWAVQQSRVRYYLDARMAAEQFQLFCVDLFDIKSVERYSAMLEKETEENVEEEACTSKATIYCAFVAAGLIGSAVKKLITGQVPPKVMAFNIREDFFFTA